MRCPICGEEHNKYGIKAHMWRAHTVEGNKHDTGKNLKTGKKIHWAKGKNKNTHPGILKQSDALKQTYKEGYVNPFKGKQHSEEAKEVLRKKRFDYLTNNDNISTYTNRHKRKLTKGENILHKIFKDNGLYDTYDIVNEYPVYPYIIDFAFVNEKIAVEYDGEPHFNKNNERIEHDIKRDDYLKTKGWKIYRIPYYELKDFNVKDLLDFINCHVV